MAAPTPFLRYSSDLRPLAWVFLAAALSVSPFLLVHAGREKLLSPTTAGAVCELGAVWFASLYARCRGPYSQHNHAHLSVFSGPRARPFNTAYDAVLTLVTGYPTALWELHHNIGHHRSFLETDADVASVRDSKTGRVYSRLWYTLRGNATIHRDSIRIAKAEATRGKPKLLQKLCFELSLQGVILAALLVLDWKITVAFLVVPNLLAAALVWWESYVHHLGVPGTGIYDGSVTTTGARFNKVNFNIGHHTAHHEKPTLHWSLLPGRTAVIAAKIPDACWRGESPGPGALLEEPTKRASGILGLLGALARVAGVTTPGI